VTGAEGTIGRAGLRGPLIAIEARDLRKAYRSGPQAVPVLHGIDLAVPQGEFVSIMGPSGSGKSTLLHLIGLLDEPDGGRLRLMGRDVAGLDENGRAVARRDLLGFVFQSFHLVARLTAQHNVMLPMAIAGMPLKQRQARAARILGTLGLDDRLHHRPSELSGGQKQRVAIARALALDPPIVLADEPTGNLDSRSSRDIMALFQRLNQAGKTVVQVTHDLTMARYGNRILHVRDGVIEREEYRQPRSATLSAPAPGPRRAVGPARRSRPRRDAP